MKEAHSDVLESIVPVPADFDIISNVETQKEVVKDHSSLDVNLSMITNIKEQPASDKNA